MSESVGSTGSRGDGGASGASGSLGVPVDGDVGANGADARPARPSWPKTIGWAAYLACSWTWCIGMFLPVLLIRDYGAWGFVAFAAPNVVGAAAMGWVLWRRGHSEAMVAAHQTVVGVFSEVTVAFQVFFLLWLIRSVSREGQWAAMASIVAMFLAFMAITPKQKPGMAAGPLMRIASSPLLVLSAATWIVSAACFGVLIARGDLHLALPTATSAPGLLWLAPVCVFGFLLCPYLDVTFHIARQYQAPSPARASFTLGFGVLFAAMIVFTALYARLVDSSRPMMAWTAGTAGMVILAVHICAQMSFTVMAHCDAEGRLAGAPRDPWSSGIRRGLLVGMAILFMTVLLARGEGRLYAGLSWAEIGYRVFMSFYGLLFPAYVWICMIPTWRNPALPTTRQVAVWLGACAVGGPMYWMGFIERDEWWLGPGLAVVLLARLLIPRSSVRLGGPGPDELSGAPVPAPTRPPTLAAGAEAER